MKFKPIISAFAAIALLCPYSTAAQTSAEAETLKLHAEISGGAASAALLDQSRSSKLTLKEGTVITVSCERDISSLYLIWDKPVEHYSVKAGSADIICGEYGFIHEYIDPIDSFTDFTVTIPEGGGILCDIYAFSEGEIPNWVQQWKPITQPVDILFVPTHGDDELLFFGGAIPYYAGELQLEAAVAFFTNHWGEPYRPHEQLNAMWTAGLRLYPIFGEYTDIKWLGEKYAKDNGMYDGMLEGEVELLRRLKPQIIVGHDIGGEYGHDTHMLNTHILLKALELSGSASNYPDSADKYGVWDVPKTYLHLYKTNPVYIEWSDIALDSFGGKTSFEIAQEAFKKYASQQSYKLTPSTPESVYNCRKFGLYRSLVGNDSACNDFMENITSYAEQYAQTTTEATTTTVETTTTTAEQTSPPETSSSVTETDSADKSGGFGIRSIIALILLIISVISVVIIKKQKGKQQSK